MQQILTECLLYVLGTVPGTRNVRMVVKTIISLIHFKKVGIPSKLGVIKMLRFLAIETSKKGKKENNSFKKQPPTMYK